MLLLLLSVLLLAAAVIRIFTESRKNYPPGPFSFPFLGSLQQGKIVNTIIHQEFEKFGEKYGNLIFFRMLMDQPVLIVRGFDFINETTHNLAFSGTLNILTEREQGLHRRRGILFSDGDNWRKSRSFVVRTLHSSGFGRKQRTDNINDELAEVLSQLEATAADGSEVSLRHIFTLAATNSLLQLVVGQKLARDGKLQHLIRLVDRNVVALGPSNVHLDLFPWLRYVAPERSGFRQFHDDVQELVTLFQPMIDAQAAVDDDPDSDAPPRHLIEAFDQEKRRGRTADFCHEENIRAILKDLFLAGMETTNSQMEWVMLALMRYPDVEARAAAEVAEVVGRDRSASIDNMPSMPYLLAFLEEVLRHTPTIPVTQHATVFGATQLRGFHVPANCRVVFDFHSVMHDRQFWGDPEVFRPERFLGPDAARLRKHVLTFGLGNRSCIGETHARQAMFLFTAGLLQKFRLRLCPGQDELLDKLESSLILKPNDFRFTVEMREE